VISEEPEVTAPAHSTLAIVGGGSWGTALSVVLAPRFESVRLWVFERDLAERVASSRENDVYLPGIRVPENVLVVSDLNAVLDGAQILLCVVPSRHARRLYEQVLPRVDPATIIVSATKGLENETLLRMSEVLSEVARRPARIAVLSGPTFAKEVARGEPAAVVIASSDAEVARAVQAAFSGPTFRLYTNSDVIGVEVGGALKNIIAIAAGVVQGLGLGNNTQAALITRGLAEITRLAVAMGAQPMTLAGLAGLGDLVLTCSGELSRNRRVGIGLARGKTLAEITASTPMIAEGVETCRAAVALGARYGVDLPIIERMNAVLYRGESPRQALRDLMERSLKGE
jgi:glycerol-3-phosphate dehydrogenase (NAD(P)+)